MRGTNFRLPTPEEAAVLDALVNSAPIPVAAMFPTLSVQDVIDIQNRWSPFNPKHPNANLDDEVKKALYEHIFGKKLNP